MKLYDESELQASIEAGERKLAVARQRKRQARRWFIGAIAFLVVVVPLGVWVGVVAGQAPPTPLLVLTWPKPKVKQVLASGQTVLARRGQPFSVSVSNPERWTITWRAGNVESQSSTIRWEPAGADDRLTANCEPRANGLTAFLTFLWPKRQVTLRCVEATKVPLPENGGMNEYTHVLSTGADGAWVYPHIFAAGEVAWDERMLPLLAAAVPVKSALASDLADGSKKPSLSTWQLVSDFEGKSTKAATEGTFAMLQTADLENVMPQLATQIIRQAPKISLKFIVRLDRSPNEGIVRLAFDGKQQRRAWVRRSGQSSGSPLTGWENGKLGDLPLNLPPAPPR
jgi:hypothetical protein